MSADHDEKPSIAKIQEDYLTCSICAVLYSSLSDKDQSRAPKDLACRHIFCKDCISRAIPSSGCLEFVCFVCRRPTPLDKGQGVDSIKTNYMVQELVAAFRPSSSSLLSLSSPVSAGSSSTNVDDRVKSSFHAIIAENNNVDDDTCEHCPEGSNTKATLYCSQCEESFCGVHAEAHAKAKKFKDHELAPKASAKKTVTRKCRIHKAKPIEYVCETCDVSLCCQKCIVDDGHQEKGHKLLSVEKYAAQQREKMRASCIHSEGLLNLQKDILTGVDTRIGVHRANCESSRAHLDNFFDRLLEIIVSCRKTWQNELEAQGSENAKLLSADKKTVQIHIDHGAFNIGRAKDMLSSLSDIEFVEQCDKLLGYIGEGNKGLMAPFTMTDISAAKYGDSVVSDLLLSVTRCLEANPFQLPSNKPLPVAVKQVEGGGGRGAFNVMYSSSSSSSSSVRLTSSFSESITLRRRPTLSTFGADTGVLGSQIFGMCLLTESSGVGIVGGGGGGVVSAQNNSTESDSILFVCDYENKRIQAMNASSGALISTIGGADQLTFPYGICLNTSADTPELFVADLSKHIVQIFDARTGTPLRSYGTTGQQGSATNQFDGPRAVCIGSMTTRATASDPLCLFVSEYSNHRIKVMNASTGAFMKTIGGVKGSGPGQLNGPFGVCLVPDTSNPGSGNLLFVVENGNHRVSVFNVLTGAFVRTIGSYGSSPGQLSNPVGIYVLPAGGSAANSSSDPMIFVADQNNNRVSIFNATSGAHVRSIAVGHNTRFVLPAISSDGEAFMYVSTKGGHVKILPL